MYKWCDIFICGLFVIVFMIPCTSCVTYLSVGSEKPIKALGVYFGNNKGECEKLNWENKIDKMNTLFLGKL